MLARTSVHRPFSKNVYRNTIVGRSSSSKPVFELHSTVSVTSLEFVRDAYEACHTLSGECKDACYIVFGLDPKNVEKYLPIVDSFERIYHKKYTKYQDIYVCHLDSMESPSIFTFGPFKFTFKSD